MVTNATITIFNRIPDKVSKKFVYVPHASDEFLRSETPSRNWTVQNGDLFIVGIWNGADRVSGINEIKKEFSGVVGEILSHSVNFFGSSKHIRLGGGS